MAASQGLSCTKCGHSRFEVDEIRTTVKISRFLNIQHKKFTAIVCAGCGYTEFYRCRHLQDWPTCWDFLAA